MGSERLSNQPSSLPPQEAVCFCGRHALQLNTFQQVIFYFFFKSLGLESLNAAFCRMTVLQMHRGFGVLL